MTELQLRSQAAACIGGWVGAKKGGSTHKAIIDLYNSQSKLPAGVKMTYSAAWCAATVSAVAVKLGMSADEFPTECSCSRMIALFQKIGRWQEADDYVPQIGDLIMYDWDDGKGTYKTTDNTGAPEHVGMVTKTGTKSFTVTEGNMSSAVGTREMEVNGRYIRGFCLPDYAAAAKRLSNGTQAATGSSVSVFKTVEVKLPILKKGCAGGAVTVLQGLLILYGYSCGKSGIDGSFGADTDKALRKFQTASGLTADGSCGALTWGALLAGSLPIEG